MRRRFTPLVLARIEAAIASVEQRHAGEIRFAIENALEPGELWRNLTARDRALQIFGLLRVWDTEANNGVLIYVLYAEHAVEIVADRGIARQVDQARWDQVCAAVTAEFRAGRFEQGAVQAIEGVAALLSAHFPQARGDPDELPNQPVLL
ncbi:MAG: TPM domain-containing protein [Steroidobacteraceae bacterium]